MVFSIRNAKLIEMNDYFFIFQVLVSKRLMSKPIFVLNLASSTVFLLVRKIWKFLTHIHFIKTKKNIKNLKLLLDNFYSTEQEKHFVPNFNWKQNPSTSLKYPSHSEKWNILIPILGHHRLLHFHSEVLRVSLQAKGFNCRGRGRTQPECLVCRRHLGLRVYHEEVPAWSQAPGCLVLRCRWNFHFGFRRHRPHELSSAHDVRTNRKWIYSG